jgi:NAD(P)-dependent dehydrogenase (short-subunit alcohol dehydrogenase family)
MKEGWLKDKALVVIGGTTGMGLSACAAFIREGANVVAIGRNPESVSHALTKLRGAVVEASDATREGSMKSRRKDGTIPSI